MSRTNIAVNAGLNQKIRFATTILRDGEGRPRYTVRSAAEEALSTWLASKQPEIQVGISQYSDTPRSKRRNRVHKSGSTLTHTKTQ